MNVAYLGCMVWLWKQRGCSLRMGVKSRSFLPALLPFPSCTGICSGKCWQKPTQCLAKPGSNLRHQINPLFLPAIVHTEKLEAFQYHTGNAYKALQQPSIDHESSVVHGSTMARCDDRISCSLLSQDRKRYSLVPEEFLIGSQRKPRVLYEIKTNKKENICLI